MSVKKQPLRLLFPIFLAALLGLACRTGSGGAEWQPNSSVAPQFDARSLPRLLVNPGDASLSIQVVDFGSQQADTRLLTRAPSLDAVLSSEYQLVGDILVTKSDEFFGLTAALPASTGLWQAAETADGLWLARVDGASGLLSASGQSPAWSPDGNWLAYRDDSGLWFVNVAVSAAPQKWSGTPYEPLAWSPDNQQILLRDGSAALLFDVATQATTRLSGVDASQIRGKPAWSLTKPEIYARYGNNGLLDPGSAHPQPDNIQSRLVAISTSGLSASLRDLLPNRRDLGVSDFLLSPDGSLLFARHFVCQTAFGNILFPFIPQRECSGSLLLVETATGNYQTLENGPLDGFWAWETSLPPADLSTLPLPESSASAAPAASGHPFWQPGAEPGQNPATAIPLGQSGERLGVITTIVTVIKGEAALALTLGADTQPPLLPPSPGYAYIAVRQRVTGAGSGRSGLYLSSRNMLVDDRLAAHQEVAWLDLEGRVIKEVLFSADSPAEYWQVFLLEADARPWLLFSPAGADNQPDLYYRLDESTLWEAPVSSAPALAPNALGVAEPARFGETTVSSDWQVTLLDPANRPASASELAQLQIAYTGGAPQPNRLMTCLSEASFQDVAGGRVIRSDIYRFLPFQVYHRVTCLLPGGVFRGWLGVLPAGTGQQTIFRFNPPSPVVSGERLFAFP